MDGAYEQAGTFGGKYKFHSLSGDFWVFWDDEAWAIIQSVVFDNLAPQLYLSQNENDAAPWGNPHWLDVNDEPNTVTFTVTLNP